MLEATTIDVAQIMKDAGQECEEVIVRAMGGSSRELKAAAARDRKTALKLYKAASAGRESVNRAAVEAAGAEELFNRLNLPVDFDLVNHYSDYADQFECPRVFHESAIISAIAAVVNPNLTISGASLDFWMLLVLTSGGGKNTCFSVLNGLLKAAGLHPRTSVEWGSPPAASQELAENPEAYFQQPEASIFLSKLLDRQFEGIKALVANGYDSHDVPDAVIYRTGSKEDTKPIRFTRPLRVSMLLASSLAWLVKYVSDTNTQGGLFPRMLLVKASSDKVIPRPAPLDLKLRTKLASKLRVISKLKGEVNFDACALAYDHWYVETQPRFKDPEAEPYWARHRGHVRKLAAIFELSATTLTELPNGILHVSEKSFLRAAEWLKAQDSALDYFFQIGAARNSYSIQRKGEWFAAAGTLGCSKSEFTRKYQGEPEWQRTGDLNTLLDAGTVLKFDTRTLPEREKGKWPTVYVHKDFKDSFDTAAFTARVTKKEGSK